MAKKSKKKRISLKSAVVLSLAVFIVAILAIGYRGMLQKEAALKETKSELAAQVDDLDEAYKELKEEWKNMDSKEFKEKVAREQLGMIGPDESLLKESEDGYTGRGEALPEEETTESSESSTDTTASYSTGASADSTSTEDYTGDTMTTEGTTEDTTEEYYSDF